MAKKKPAAAKRAKTTDSVREAAPEKSGESTFEAALREMLDRKNRDHDCEIEKARTRAREYVDRFKVSDLVMLRSGGPCMTVTAVTTDLMRFENGFKASGKAKVSWSQGGSICSENYCFSTLVPYEDVPLSNVD